MQTALRWQAHREIRSQTQRRDHLRRSDSVTDQRWSVCPALILNYSSDTLINVASGMAKASLFDALASVAQALGNGRRAEIVDLLAQGERSVDEIASEISQSVANTSQHLFGCTTYSKFAVVDAHADLVDDYLAIANAIGAPIVAVFETHVQADHVSGLPQLVEETWSDRQSSRRVRGRVRARCAKRQ